MSPPPLRRYRAERSLRRDFVALQAGVCANVAGRLHARGVSLDRADLEACYAAAWHGLYMQLLDGRTVEDPGAWLVLVTFRRAIDEHRCRLRARRRAELVAGGADARAGGPDRERDLAAELDDRARLRHLFEGMRARLSERERAAAVLCYLHGLPRADAAARIGLSDGAMRRLMEGRGSRRPGVAHKVGELVRSISGGEWCEEQGSLMRALAFGVLDPGGERYRLAQAHRGECPACRAYVVSLRRLAAALAPAPYALGLCRGLCASAARVVHRLAPRAGVGPAPVSAPAAAGAGAPLAGGAAGGGGLMLAGGPLAAKLAVGCLLAVGVGAGCVTLGGLGVHGPARPHVSRGTPAARRVLVTSRTPSDASLLVPAPSPPAAGAVAGAPATRLAPLARAGREFGPERAGAAQRPAAALATARAAATARSAGSSGPSSAAPGPAAPAPSMRGTASRAVREFSPG